MFRFTRSPDMEAIRGEMLRSLIFDLEGELQANLSAFRKMLDDGQKTSAVQRHLVHSLATTLMQCQTHTRDVELQYQMAEHTISIQQQELEYLRQEAVTRELAAARIALRDSAERLQKTEANLLSTQLALSAEQNARQQDVEKLRQYIAAQNTIIARLQLRLNKLLGITSGADTPGEKE